jgi:hypothetical protein
VNLAAYAMDRDDSQVDISNIQFASSGGSATSFNNLVTINAPAPRKSVASRPSSPCARSKA